MLVEDDMVGGSWVVWCWRHGWCGLLCRDEVYTASCELQKRSFLAAAVINVLGENRKHVRR
jgi:hypothetical protein